MPRKPAAKKVAPRKKKVIDVPVSSIFDPIEKELIMADIALLKQKEIDSGDWAKWEEDQRKIDRSYGRSRFSSIPVNVVITPVPNPVNLDDPNWNYNRSRFIAATGREPINDDLDRANCIAAGTVGHWSCGWCTNCDKPRFVCGHGVSRT